jgi:hypothetical protein
MLFDNLERKALGLIKRKFHIETELVDTDKELSLVVKSIFDGKVVTSHTQDLLPLLKAFEKRMKK